MTAAIANVVYLANSREPMTDSRRLAEAFGVQHNNVLRKIRNILAETPEIFGRLNFEQTSYVEQQNGQRYEMFEMTRDGFMHIALTFTGKKGNSFRVRVIEQFNAMERELGRLQPSKQPEDLSITDLLAMANRILEKTSDFSPRQGKTR